ncbi:hypothetical protein AMJ52_04920 [candidate division TA06 bacterium DG_78]|uniref:Uncharacterized protein n=1 Tax=candidate division TA06 bacterium DG_78 TaxID=1703772 RepID=A0A0S7YDP0_UNCT6|nr:MAG: hypothetical protein AMJ52_04920 [candidate division TA06 bacterium DG_78]
MKKIENLVGIAVVLVLLYFFIFRVLDRIPILRLVLYLASIGTAIYFLYRFARRIAIVRMLLIFVITAVFIAGIIYGGMLGDFVETETVGSIICLSCMGIE